MESKAIDVEGALLEQKFIVPYERNHLFVGQETFLKDLHVLLSTSTPHKYNHRVAVFGLGGIGKTQSVLEYAYRQREDYERVYWIPVETQESLFRGYAKVAKAAHVPGCQVDDPAEIATQVLRWLQEQPSWLLILDNLVDVNAVKDILLQNTARKHTIITTRNPRADDIPAEPLELPLMNYEDSLELLLLRSGISSDTEKPAAQEIVKTLGYLPLAIELAAAYIRHVTGNFASYLDEYRRNENELLTWIGTANRPYPDSVATTWIMAFRQVEMNQPFAKLLLHLFAYLNPDNILLEFLIFGLKDLNDGEGFAATMTEPSQLDPILLEMERFSLIKWNRQAQIISIHRLVQSVLRHEMSKELRDVVTTVFFLLCEKAFPNPDRVSAEDI